MKRRNGRERLETGNDLKGRDEVNATEADRQPGRED